MTGVARVQDSPYDGPRISADYKRLLCWGAALVAGPHPRLPCASAADMSANRCQSFELSIAVGRYVVKKQYPGALGFARFVQEFKDGTTRLPIAQFPEFEDRLAALGIRYFDLNFRFKQHMPMLNRLATSQLATPPIVADCWDLSTTTLAMEL